jgi:hypothetical protein
LVTISLVQVAVDQVSSVGRMFGPGNQRRKRDFCWLDSAMWMTTCCSFCVQNC